MCRYKFAGANATDSSGALDSVEFINVSKDDALAFPDIVHRKYPLTVEERMDSAVRPFVRKSLEVNRTLMSILNDRLGLPPGCLAKLHAPEEHSGSETRCIKKTPSSTSEPPDRAAIGAHTDFGSLVRGRGMPAQLPLGSPLTWHDSRFCIIGWAASRYCLLARMSGSMLKYVNGFIRFNSPLRVA